MPVCEHTQTLCVELLSIWEEPAQLFFPAWFDQENAGRRRRLPLQGRGPEQDGHRRLPRREERLQRGRPEVLRRPPRFYRPHFGASPKTISLEFQVTAVEPGKGKMH